MATLRHAVGTLRRIADWGARVCIAEQGNSDPLSVRRCCAYLAQDTACMDMAT
jgi:hypothetical protein